MKAFGSDNCTTYIKQTDLENDSYLYKCRILISNKQANENFELD